MKATRREFLSGAVALAAAEAMPFGPALGAPIAVVPIEAPTFAFVVGTPGEHDGQFVRAHNAREALEKWIDERWSYGPEGPSADRECPHCEALPCTCDVNKLVTRVPAWDAFDGEPTSGDWIDRGFGHICERCNYEIGDSSDGYNVRGEAVHSDCMELADWKLVDPERYAEIVEEMMTDAFGPDVNDPWSWQ